MKNRGNDFAMLNVSALATAVKLYREAPAPPLETSSEEAVPKSPRARPMAASAFARRERLARKNPPLDFSLSSFS